MKKIIAVFVLVLSLNLLASPNYYPENYDRILENGSAPSNELKGILFDILNKYHNPQKDKRDTLSSSCSGQGCYRQLTLSYSEARKFLFGKIHLNKDETGYYVKDVYCNKTFRKSAGVGPNMIPDSNRINCEHTWPQSKFTTTFSRDMQKGDLNHLYPTDTKANSTRGNYPFADVYGTSVDSNCNDSAIGSPRDYTKSTYFEPPQEHKGNVARALFYFSVRYKTAISPTQENHLRRWHEEDPVDEEEINRNNMVQEIQGNRNPFIDYPQLVEKIEDF